MARKIVLLCDGTGNSAAKAFKTNVWRLYQALDLQGGSQIAAFSDGVGTSSFRLFAILGLALGFGIRSRVLALYKFLCLNFREGDEIYAFGFSRGAFVVRLLVGMVQREGLVEFKSEEELDRNAAAAYRSFRREAFKVGPIRFWVPLYRAIRDGYYGLVNWLTGARRYAEVRPSSGPRAAGKVRVHFLGVWDTVAAYGLPVEELTRAIDNMVWPLTFESCDLLPCVDVARQAFAIDDERRTFFPIRWNETPELIEEKDGKPARLRQVWFAGSHSNVGGGYPDDRLAHLPLCWMIAEAARCGLIFKQDVVADYWDFASESGRVYDSRAGAGITYRYHPRSAADLMGGSKPLIDSSVILRLKRGDDRYAPIAVPSKIEVLTPLGERRELAFVAQTESADRQRVKDYLPLPKGRQRKLAVMQGNVLEVMASITPTDKEQNAKDVDLLMDTVWWRRLLYFVMLGFVIYLILLPLLAGYAKVRFNEIGNGIVGPIIGLIEGFLPGFAKPWTDAISNNSVIAVSIVAAFGLCLWLNNVLRRRIVDRSRAVWSASERADGELLAVNRKVANRRSSLAGAAICFAIAAASVGITSEPQIDAAAAQANATAAQNNPLQAGQSAEGSNTVRMGGISPADAEKVSSGKVPFFGTDWLPTIFAILGTICLIAWIHMSAARTPASKDGSAAGADNDIPLTLSVARWFRYNSWAAKVYDIGACWVAPVAFLFAAFVLCIAVANKVAFQTASAVGVFCPEATGNNPRQYQKLRVNTDKVATFSIDSMCHDTGLRLDAGVTYKLTLAIQDPWFDRGEWTDVRGFSPSDVTTESSFRYYLGYLFKRWWGQPYFKPIVRVNQRGNDEYVLEQLQPERWMRGQAKVLFAVLTPRTSGELYFYVNDASIALPGLSGIFYANNRGTGTIKVDRVSLDAFD